MAFWKSTILGALCCAATGAAAQITTYDCDMNSLEGRGFITERMIFTVDTARNAAAVVDGIVMAVYDKPVAAEFEQLNNGQYRLKWEVRNLKSGANSFNVDYRIQFRPNDRSVSIRANLRGYDNRPIGSGTCKVVPGQSLLN